MSSGRAAAVVVAAMWALAACGNSDSTGTASTSTEGTGTEGTAATDSGTTSTASTGMASDEADPADPLELPEAATVQDAPGAAAFTEHYAEQLAAALRTGETEALDELTADRCGSCRAVVEEIDRRRDEGTLLPEGIYTITSAGPGVLGGDVALASVDVSIDGYELPEGGAVEPMDVQLRSGLRWVDDHWEVDTWTVDPPEGQDESLDPVVQASGDSAAGADPTTSTP